MNENIERIDVKNLEKVEFDAFIELWRSDYVSSLVVAGLCSLNDAKQRVDDSYKRTLENGIDSEGQIFKAIYLSSSRQLLGYLWFSELNAVECGYYVSYIYVLQSFRGKGVASRSLNWLENYAKLNGVHTIRLSVFPANKSARNLYLKAGFLESLVSMVKKV